MDIEKYNKKMKKASTAYEAEIKKVNKEYALTNNTVQVGDMISDHIGSGKVEAIGVYLSDPPSCFYNCVAYTKAGGPSKREPRRRLFQSNLKL